MRIFRRASGFLAIGFLMCTVGWADVRLPKVFGDHMVLQRDQIITIWGWADAGETVIARMGANTVSTIADRDGRWSAILPQLEAGGPYTISVQGKKNTVELKDILIGDVWLCSGQSNMEWRILHSLDGEMEVASANHPQIRVLTVANRVDLEPAEDFDAAWTVCRPRAALDYSAVAYYFARTLQKDLDVPIGLVHSSWGGSRVEPWISGETEAAKDSPVFQKLEKAWAGDYASQGDEIDAYYDVMGDWIEDSYIGGNFGKSVAAYVQPPDTEQSMGVFPGSPRLTYNAMIAPIRQMPLSGVIWYQGESNASAAWDYRDVFSTLIEDWREALGQKDLPFLFVQLANYMQRTEKPGDSAWAELREAQAHALKLPNTGMAVTIDIGDADDIHPKNKEDVGKRLALAAKRIAYGKNVEHSGPVLKKAKRKGKSMELTFDHADSGLAARDDAPLAGFAIAGEDKAWFWAQAEIDGKKIRVWSDDVATPVAVRYGWANNPDCNLYNGAGLPASPFRTDDWPVTTQKAE